MGGVGGVGGGAREQCGSNNHPLCFLSYLGRCGGWAREAGRGEGEMGGDQTSVGATKGVV